MRKWLGVEPTPGGAGAAAGSCALSPAPSRGAERARRGAGDPAGSPGSTRLAQAALPGFAVSAG